MHILVTRPETEAARTTRQLEAMGHRVSIAPLLEVVTEAPHLELASVQALILTSRNAVHALATHPQKQALTAFPVFAVGKSTAAAAREAGFTVALQGDAGGAELTTLITTRCDAAAGPLLHLSGEAIAFDLSAALAPTGYTVLRSTVYESIPVQRLPADVVQLLTSGVLDAVLLMSPRTAEAWTTLVARAGLAERARALLHICLSPGVATTLAPLDPAQIEIAIKPNEEQMLALVARLASSSADNA